MENLLARAMDALTRKDFVEARTILASIPENLEANIQLAYLLQQGLGGAVDNLRATHLYEAAISLGDNRSYYYLGSIYLAEKQLTKAVKQFELAAKEKNPSGAYWASALHDGYLGHPVDQSMASQYRKLASDLGHIFAQRDEMKIQMKQGSTWSGRLKGFVGYVRVKFKGALLAIRDPQSLQLR